jgi:hypothetical protein
LGLRKPTILAAANAAKLAGLILFLPYGVSNAGIYGAAIAAVLAEIGRYLVLGWGQVRWKVSFFAQDLAASAVLLVLAFLIGWIVGELHSTKSLATILLAAPAAS